MTANESPRDEFTMLCSACARPIPMGEVKYLEQRPICSLCYPRESRWGSRAPWAAGFVCAFLSHCLSYVVGGAVAGAFLRIDREAAAYMSVILSPGWVIAVGLYAFLAAKVRLPFICATAAILGFAHAGLLKWIVSS